MDSARLFWLNRTVSRPVSRACSEGSRAPICRKMSLDFEVRRTLMKKLNSGRGVFERFLSLMLIAIPVSLCLLPATAFAQRSPVSMLSNAPSSSEKLTLVGAVDLALRQNLDIQIANIETATRQQDRVIARSELLPHASFEADDSVNRHNLRALLGIQIPIPIIPHNIGPYQAVHVGPTFSAPIFDLTLIRQYQASGHRLLAS